MQYEANVLGSNFSNWVQLTEEYASGLEAMRRREPGASARMMHIAHRLKQHGSQYGSQVSPPATAQGEVAESRGRPTETWFANAKQLVNRFLVQTQQPGGALVS